MTAAQESVTPFGSAATPSFSTFSHRIRRWERVLVLLGVCLPIPLFAATGLSVPLPETVERIAAALVPWADESALDEGQAFSLGEDGSIVLAAGERSAGAPEGTSASVSAAASLRLQLKEHSPVKSSPSDGTGTGTDSQGKESHHQNDGGGQPSTTTQVGGQSQDPAGSGSSGAGPVQATVGGVIGAADPVVGVVDGAADGAGAGDIVGGVVDGVGGAAGDTAGSVDEIVGGLGK
jgi:hypothetical protein